MITEKESTTSIDVKCIGCTGHSEGNRCERCQPGYFSHSNSTCIPCQCNGHGEDAKCNPGMALLLLYICICVYTVYKWIYLLF